MSLVRVSLVLALSLIWISSAQAQGLLERLEKRLEGVLGDERAAPAAAEPERVEPGYLGLTADDDDAGRGVKVLSVRGGGPAEAAGLQAGDVIVAVNDAVVTKLEDMQAQLVRKLVGEKVNFKVDRGGAERTIAVTLGRRPAPLAPGRASADELPPPFEATPPELAPGTRASLGVTILPVTDDARRRYGLSVRQGALIGSITRGGAADRAGLPIGGVVVAADGRRIDSPDDLIGVIQGMRPGETLLLSYYQGATLFRKSIKLAEAPGEARVVAAEEPRVPPDRPLLRRLERALEGAAAPVERPAGVPLAPDADLRTEVTRLRERVDELERRLAELEGRREAKPDKPAEEPDPAAEDDGPRLKPAAPPAEPPPRPEPGVR
jgi:membrane-associated protease RseP (regulator of RpoE activity)